jgi:DivIVA domain-containing protein
MPVEPDGLEAKTFRRRWRGYDAEEVRGFLREMAAELRQSDDFHRAGHEVAIALRQMHQSIVNLEREHENAAAGARAAAEAASTHLLEEARTEAAVLLEDAKAEAAALLEEARVESDRERTEVLADCERMRAEAATDAATTRNGAKSEVDDAWAKAQAECTLARALADDALAKARTERSLAEQERKAVSAMRIQAEMQAAAIIAKAEADAAQRVEQGEERVRLLEGSLAERATAEVEQLLNERREELQSLESLVALQHAALNNVTGQLQQVASTIQGMIGSRQAPTAEAEEGPAHDAPPNATDETSADTFPQRSNRDEDWMERFSEPSRPIE